MSVSYRRLLLRREAVDPGAVGAEDRALHRAVGRAHRREAVLLLDVLRDLEPAQRLDLPLRRAGPERVGAPDDVVGAHALDHRAEHERAHARLGHVAVGEDLAEVGVDVVHAVLPGDVGEVGDPVDAAGALQLVPGVRGRAARAGDPAVRRVVDHEVELRPVLGRLADVVDVAVADEVRELRLDRRREQALVDADVLQAGAVRILRHLHQLLVERDTSASRRRAGTGAWRGACWCCRRSCSPSTSRASASRSPRRTCRASRASRA